METKSGAPGKNLVRQAGLLSVGRGPLVCLQPRVRPRAHVRHLPERVVGDVEGEVVAGGLEHRQRLLDERVQLLRRSLRLEEGAEQLLLDPPAQLADTIARSRGPLGEGIRAPERVAALACPEQGVDELGFEGEVELGRRHERGGALEQAHGGTVVLAEVRAPAGGGQAAPRRRCQRAVVRQRELGSGRARPARSDNREDPSSSTRAVPCSSSQDAKRACSSARVAFGSAS